jgi:hypothetical protein
MATSWVSRVHLYFAWSPPTRRQAAFLLEVIRSLDGGRTVEPNNGALCGQCAEKALHVEFTPVELRWRF